jgi:Flp pilus assembly protein TadG
MAFLIPLLVIIIGATISFGLFFYQANTLQQAVDVAAMEISRYPFSATAKLGLGDLNADHDESLLMDDPSFKQQIYDETQLIISEANWNPSFVDALPLLNRLLTQVMVRDESGNQPVYRYPGAIVTNHEGSETVLIPIVGYASDGTESILEWVAPVEEIRPGDGEGPYSLTATNSAASFVPGMVALRINYPAQSTTLMNRVGNEGEVIVDARDDELADGDTGSNYSLVIPAEAGVADTTIHSGRFGLGRQAAGVYDRQSYLLRSAGVRPYRKVISVQAIYRREVFQ